MKHLKQLFNSPLVIASYIFSITIMSMVFIPISFFMFVRGYYFGLFFMQAIAPVFDSMHKIHIFWGLLDFKSLKNEIDRLDEYLDSWP